MPYTVERDPEREFVSVVFFGDVGIEDVCLAREKAWELAQAEGLYRFFTRFEDARLQIETRDLINPQLHYEAIGMHRAMKSALLIPKDARIAEDATVHEYMANRSSWKVRVFFDRTQAMDWLMSEAP
ncbi:MAG: hypothetical protein P8X48_08155 [Acidiferrobacteraceae bacterium]|jgi:hypothetical protein